MAFQVPPTPIKSLFHTPTRLIFLKCKANYVNCLKWSDVFLLQQNKIQTSTRPSDLLLAHVSDLTIPQPSCLVGLITYILFTLFGPFSVFRVSWNVDTKADSIPSSVPNWSFLSSEKLSPSTLATVSFLPQPFPSVSTAYFIFIMALPNSLWNLLLFICLLSVYSSCPFSRM